MEILDVLNPWINVSSSQKVMVVKKKKKKNGIRSRINKTPFFPFPIVRPFVTIFLPDKCGKSVSAYLRSYIVERW